MLLIWIVAARSTCVDPGSRQRWYQGDWLPSRVTEKEERDLVAGGFVPEMKWRLPDASKVKPAPNPDERLLLTSHIDRGFSMPPHPFFRAFLNYFGMQLRHLPPSAMTYLASFMSLCENFIGTDPHWFFFQTQVHLPPAKYKEGAFECFEDRCGPIV